MNEQGRTPGRRLTSSVLAGLFALLGMVACSGDTTAPGSTGGSGGSGGGGGASDPGGDRDPVGQITITIDIWNRQFLPPGAVDATLSMGLGQKVRWVNHDATPHRVTAVVVPDGAKPFTGHIASRADGGEFVFEPSMKGVWEYICEIHPQLMSGGRLLVH